VSRPGWLNRALGRLPAPVRPASDIGALLSPLTRERIADYLRHRGYRFVVDDDGDLTGTWDGNRFWFLLLGDDHEIAQVRGRWHRSVPPELAGQLALTVNDWNRDRIWPKVYSREEDGELAVYAEVSADLEPGVNDVQLAQLVACGLGTGVQLFTALSELIPEPGGSAPATDVPDN